MATQSAGSILHSFLSEIGEDLVSSGSGILTTALTNLENNPTVENAAAQGAAIALAAPLALPNLASEVIKQGAQAGLALLQLGAAAASGTTSTGTTATATAA